jgi:hypothetical protein
MKRNRASRRPASPLVIRLAPAEQRVFWKALKEPPVLTAAQRELGRLMRGGR